LKPLESLVSARPLFIARLRGMPKFQNQHNQDVAVFCYIKF
jgi:hypothetical protein